MRPCDVVLCLHSTTTLPQVPFHSIIGSLKAILESRGSFWSAGMSCPSAARCLSASKLLLNLRMCNLLLLRCWDGSGACSVYVSDLLHIVLEMKCASVLTTETAPLIIDILVQLVVRRRSSDAPNDATKHSMLRNSRHLGWARRRLSLAGLQLCIHGAVLDGDLESAEVLAQHAVLTNRLRIPNTQTISTQCAGSGDSRALALALLWQAWEKHDSCSISTRCYASKRYGASAIIERAETAACDFPKLEVSSIHSSLGLSTALYHSLRYFLAASFAKHKAKMTLADCRQRMVRYALRAMHLALNTLHMEPMSHTRNVQADVHILPSNSQWAEHVCGCNMMNMIDACLVVIIASVGSPWCTAHVYATVQRLCILNEEPLLSLYGAISPALQRTFSKEWAHMCQRRLVYAVDTVVTLVTFGWPWTGSHLLFHDIYGLLCQQSSVITASHHDKAPEFLLPDLRMLGWAVVIFMIECTSGDEGVVVRCRTHTSTVSDKMACRDREAWGEVKLATGVVAPLLKGLQSEGLAHYDRLRQSIARLLAVHLTHVLWGFSRCKILHCLTTLVGLYINSDIDARCLAKSCLVKEANRVLSHVGASPMTRMIAFSIPRGGGHKVLDLSPQGGGIVMGSLAPSSLEAIQRADPSEDSRNGHALFDWKAWYIRDHNVVQPQTSVYSATRKTRESPKMHAVTNTSLLSYSLNSTSNRTQSLSLTSCLLPSAYCEMCCQPAWRMLWSWCLVEYRDQRWGGVLVLCILHGVAIARSLHSVTSDSDDVDWIVATSSLASSLPSCVACLSPCCFDLCRVSVDVPMQVYREKLHRDACCMILHKVRKNSACLFQVPQTRKMYLLALGVLVELNSPIYTGYRGQFNAACAIIQGLELSKCDACSTTSTYLHTHEVLSALVSSTDCLLESQHAVVKFGVSLMELSKEPKPSMNTVELTKAINSLWMHLLVRARSACHTSTALGVSYLTIARSLLDAFCGAHECVPWSYVKTTRSTVKTSMLAATTGGALVHTLIAHIRVCLDNRGCSTSCVENDECRRWVLLRHLRQLLLMLSNRELCGLISKIVQHRKLSMSHNEIVEAFQVSKDVMPSFKEWAWCSVTVARRRTRGRRKLLVLFRSVVSPFWKVAFRNMPVCALGYKWGLFAANVITCKHFVSLGWCGNAADAKEDIVGQGPTVGLLASRTSFLLQESVVSCFIAFIITFRTARRLLRSRGRKKDLACEVEAPLIHVSSCVIPLECLLQIHNLQIDRPRNTQHGLSVNDARRFGFQKAIASVSLHCVAQVEGCTGRQGRNCEGDLIMANVVLRGVFRIQHGSNQGDCACPLL